MKIINVGTYPPPIGGVSNYLKRLHTTLLNKNKDALLIDISKQKSQTEGLLCKSEWGMFFQLMFFQKRALVHFHVYSLKLNVLYFIISLKHFAVITFHNERFYDLIRSKGKIVYLFQSMFLNSMARLIVINKNCQDIALKFVRNDKKLLLINNFIPPLSVPKMVDEKILQARQNHKFVISSNAWKICFHKNEDLYGIDILIDMMNEIVKEYDAIFIFMLPNIGEEEYFENLNQKINDYNLQNNFLFITKPLESGASLWQISDLVIRATNTDGSSLTVLEALGLGTPVLASDCVERPDEAILFKSRSLADLTQKTKEILDNLSIYKEKVKETNSMNELDLLLNFYDETIKNNK